MEKGELKLKEFGHGLIEADKKISGVKIVVFYEDGELVEYSSKRDNSLDEKFRKVQE